jgi:probable rRNA maturation factor
MKDEAFVELINHQNELALPSSWIAELQRAACRVWALLPEHACGDNHLSEIEVLDIAFVSAGESDRIHREFMDIAGATDVITFLHGELIICPAIAVAQASEHGEPVLRELLRYIIHGMLHLAGHLDDQESQRIRMEHAQESLVAMLWSDLDFSVFSDENAKITEK